MTSIRTRISSVALIAAMATMMGGPLVAAAPHEVCDAMYHACDKIDALASCCCGDRSDTNPLQVPSGRAEVTGSSHAMIAVAPFVLPAVTVLFVREGLPALARPPDLRILFSDLRL